MNNYFISGGISGAITDPDSPAGQKHAKLYYEEIRRDKYDIDRIFKNLNREFSLEQLRSIKKLFIYR